MKKTLVVSILALSSFPAFADVYSVGGSATGGQLSIYNKTTKEYILVDYLDKFNRSNPFRNLDTDGDPDNIGLDITYNGGVDPNQPSDTLGYMGITDIRGDKIIFEHDTTDSNRNILIVENGSSTYFYGRKAVYNITSATIESDILIARTQEAYDFAVSRGYQAELVEEPEEVHESAYTFETFSTNVLNDEASGGGIRTDKVVDSDGNSMIRSEDDGTIHIGNNSFVFNEAGVNGFTHDTMYSSLGTLQIGDGPDHRTIVEGTLEIQDPTEANHAATKSYVDTSAALAMAMTALPKSYNGKTVLGMAGGHSGDRSAFALGLSKSQIGGNIHFNANVGYSQATSFAGAIGVGIEW